MCLVIGRWGSLQLRSMSNTFCQLKRYLSFMYLFYVIQVHLQLLTWLCCHLYQKFLFLALKRKDDFISVAMEYLRMNGAYWGLTTLDLLGKLDAVDVDEVVSWIMKCQHESGFHRCLLFLLYIMSEKLLGDAPNPPN